MKYFKNIQNLSELKKQYRVLAIANHPDKGGDTEVMQSINAEFDAMFEVLKRKPETVVTEEERKETATAYRRHFYTSNGWEGCRYNSNLSAKDIAARVKVYTKERYPDFKFSVRSEYFSMGCAVHIRLVSGPVPALTPDCGREYISTMSEIANYPGITDEVRAVMADVVDYANSYNYDDSDSMTDYFDTNFYLHIYIGDFGKPYQVVAPKAKKVAGKAAPKAEAVEDSFMKFVEPLNILLVMIETILKLKRQRANAAAQAEAVTETVECPVIVEQEDTLQTEPQTELQTEPKTEPKTEARTKRRSTTRKEVKNQETPTPKKEKENRFTLVVYSDKCLALFGDTKSVKDQLKAIGGRYNPNLRPFGNDTKAPGWVFSKNKRAEIEKIIN